jgi:hypothetical protein
MAENIEIVVLILKIEFYTIFPKPTSLFFYIITTNVRINACVFR